VVTDPYRLVSQAVPSLDLRPGHSPLVRGAGPRSRIRREGVQAEVQPGESIEDPLEPLSRPAEGLRLRLPDLLLHVREARGAASVAVAGGTNEVVPPQLHGVSPLTRRYAATSRPTRAVDANGKAASRPPMASFAARSVSART